MGGSSNVTIARPDKHFKLDALPKVEENLPTKPLHSIDGEKEDIGGFHSEVDGAKPRGKEWRKELARKINEEMKNKWRKGEEAARAKLNGQRADGLKAPSPK